MDGRAHAPERGGQSALRKEKNRERNTEREREREREQGERARARVLWTAYWALVLCAGLCGWALSSSCPPLVLVLAAPLNSVAGLCGPALWLVSVARLTGEECGRTNSDVNADKNSWMQFALGVKVGRTKKSVD